MLIDMDLLFIFGLSTKAYANLLVYGSIAFFFIVGIPLSIRIGKRLKESLKSSFSIIDYTLRRPQRPRFNLPKDTKIIIKIKEEKANDSEPQDAQTEPDAPEPSEPES